MIALYMDDCCIFGHNVQVIDELKAALAEDFLLHDEGSIKDFLGARLSFAPDPASPNGPKLMTGMTQTSHIDSILDDVGLCQSPEYATANDPDSNVKVPPKIKHIPATSPLHNNINTPPMIAIWNYHSVIG
jgi:hypothetical protein